MVKMLREMQDAVKCFTFLCVVILYFSYAPCVDIFYCVTCFLFHVLCFIYRYVHFRNSRN